MSDIDLDELRSELDDFAPPETVGSSSMREQRIIAGFEEIQRFVAENGRLPQHGEDRDIFERLYAVRLDRIRASAECRTVLAELDSHGFLTHAADSGDRVIREDEVKYHAGGPADSEPTDEELISALRGEGTDEGDITRLTHVRSREEIRAAEEVAQRNACEDFELFQPLFDKVQADLRSGQRQTFKFQDNAEINKGDFFILDGQKVYVAEMGEPFVSDYGRPDRRLRVIYDNGTESDLLLRSLQRALNKDKVSRRITQPDLGPLFSDEESDGDLPAGCIYVLRSKSNHPFIAEHRTVIHKIGVTGGEVKKRVANASKDPTYLLAEVEIVGLYKLSNINRKALETLLHKFFSSARLDMELKDRFGSGVEPREWFLVPLDVIAEAIDKIKQGTIGNFKYDRETARIAPID